MQIAEDGNRRPFLVVASAGTTNTGAIDPLEEIAAVCRAHELWFHIDGAYGATFALCEEGRRRLQGLDFQEKKEDQKCKTKISQEVRSECGLPAHHEGWQVQQEQLLVQP